MSKRSKFNQTVTATARKQGVYAEVLANWPAVQAAYAEGKTPAATVKGIKAIIADLAPTAPAKLAAPEMVPAKDLPRLEAKTPERTLTEKIALWVSDGEAHVPTTNPMAFPCGYAYVVVYVSGRSPIAKALKDNGFERVGAGCYKRAFWCDGQSADAAFEKAAVTAKHLDRTFSVYHKGEDVSVYAQTVID